MWRPAFPFAERHPAYVLGWSRRFWQGSTDHRGIPGAPGRVVTLVESPGERCWGMAYRVSRRDAPPVLAKLDHREKGGYERLDVTLFLAARARPPAREQQGLLYLATPGNPNYLGPAEVDAIAAQVAVSRGPSGPNPEYVFQLAGALRAMGAQDPHVFELEDRLRVRSSRAPR